MAVMPDVSLELIVLLSNVAATWFMAGLIWFVQVVHYPLFDGVAGGDAFAAFHARHTSRTTLVVAPAMLIEAVSAAALVAIRPSAVGAPLAWCGLAMVVATWLSTFAIQVPCHNRLARGFDAAVGRRLCRSNWIRTALWSARAMLVTHVLIRVIAAAGQR